MTERLTCSNCGAPLTREAGRTHVICPHCKSATDFPPDPSTRERRDRGRGEEEQGVPNVPNIVIIQTGPTVVSGGPSPVYVRRRGSSSWLFSVLFFVVVSVAISAYIRHRVSHAVAEANSAEKQVEKAVEKSEKGAEKKHH